MLQPPYSPDLASCDCFLFQKVKKALKEHHFESTEDTQKSVTQVLNDIPKMRSRNATKITAQLEMVCAGTTDVLEGDHIVVDE
jgi:hypothetical protein